MPPKLRRPNCAHQAVAEPKPPSVARHAHQPPALAQRQRRPVVRLGRPLLALPAAALAARCLLLELVLRPHRLGLLAGCGRVATGPGRRAQRMGRGNGAQGGRAQGGLNKWAPRDPARRAGGRAQAPGAQHRECPGAPESTPGAALALAWSSGLCSWCTPAPCPHAGSQLSSASPAQPPQVVAAPLGQQPSNPHARNGRRPRSAPGVAALVTHTEITSGRSRREPRKSHLQSPAPPAALGRQRPAAGCRPGRPPAPRPPPAPRRRQRPAPRAPPRPRPRPRPRQQQSQCRRWAPPPARAAPAALLAPAPAQRQRQRRRKRAPPPPPRGGASGGGAGGAPAAPPALCMAPAQSRAAACSRAACLGWRAGAGSGERGATLSCRACCYRPTASGDVLILSHSASPP